MSRVWSVLLLPLVALAACGGGEDDAAIPPSTTKLSPAQARPTAPPAAAALAAYPPDARTTRRVGFVNAAALEAGELPVRAEDLERAVLGAPAPAAGPAVAIGDPPRLTPPPETAPQLGLLEAEGMAAVQGCLGTDPLAETILPSAWGPDSVLGASLSRTSDEPAGPAGLVVRICSAPVLKRDSKRFDELVERRFGGRSPRPQLAETEYSETETHFAVIPVEALSAQEVLDLASGAKTLQMLSARG